MRHREGRVGTPALNTRAPAPSTGTKTQDHMPLSQAGWPCDHTPSCLLPTPVYGQPVGRKKLSLIGQRLLPIRLWVSGLPGSLQDNLPSFGTGHMLLPDLKALLRHSTAPKGQLWSQKPIRQRKAQSP